MNIIPQYHESSRNKDYREKKEAYSYMYQMSYILRFLVDQYVLTIDTQREVGVTRPGQASRLQAHRCTSALGLYPWLLHFTFRPNFHKTDHGQVPT